MGILAAILGQNNPVAQFASANHGWLSQVGAGLAQGPTFSEGLANAARLGPAGQLIDQQYAKDAADKQARQDAINQSAQDLQRFPDLLHAVQSGAIDPAAAYSEAWKRSAPGYGGSSADITSTYQGRIQAGKEQGLTGSDLTTFALTGKLPGGNQTVRAGVGQPIYGKNKTTGDIVPFEPMTDGTLVNTIDPNAKLSDFTFDPGIGAGAKATGQVDAKTAAAARASLPGVEQAYTVTQKTLAALTGDPSVMAGQKENFGKIGGVIPQQMLPSIVGTNRANFKNVVDQLSGQAFLNIRQALKGAGQVTDYEGQKGEIALSRMKAAADSGDEQAFMQAVADYQDAINNGIALLRQQAGGGFAAGQPAVSGGTSQGTGQTYTYNPSTGQLE